MHEAGLTCRALDPGDGTSDWTHLAATFDAPTKTLRLFVNGKMEASTVQTFTPWSATGPLVLGKCRVKGLDCDRWTGRIAEVATFDTRLPDAEITGQYNAADRSATGVSMPASSVSTIDLKGNPSSQLYSLYSGQQIATIDPLGNLTQYGYDLTTGTMKLTVDPNGNKTEFLYDARGNVVEQSTWQDQSDSTTKSTTRFTYFPDATTKYPAPDPRNDKLLTVRDARSTGATDNRYLTAYSYDSRGNLTAVADPRGTTTTTLTDGTTGVPAGLATKETTPGGAVTSTTFTPSGDIQEVVDPAGNRTRFTYDGLGRVVAQTGITKSTPLGLTARIAYDKLGRIVTMTEPGVLNRLTGAIHTAVTTYVTVSTKPVDSTGEAKVAEGQGGRSTRGPTETVLHTTQNHPFWDATAQAWVHAEDLRPGISTLAGPNGETQYIAAVSTFTGAQEMRDLTVDVIHTYYVLAGTEPVLVHNINPNCYTSVFETELHKDDWGKSRPTHFRRSAHALLKAMDASPDLEKYLDEVVGPGRHGETLRQQLEGNPARGSAGLGVAARDQGTGPRARRGHAASAVV